MMRGMDGLGRFVRFAGGRFRFAFPLRTFALQGVLLAALSGCAEEAPENPGNREMDPETAGASTDSGGEATPAVPGPRDEEVDPFILASLDAFREGLPRVDTLSGGAASREALIEDFLDALRMADTTAFAAMAQTRGEFAWIQYPESRYLTRPYELPPDVVWMTQTNLSSRGLGRLLRQYSGEPLEGVHHECPSDPEVEGASRFWRNCVLVSILPSGDTIREKAFGSIWERGGRYKFIGYSNEY